MTEFYLDNSATTPLCEAAIAKMRDVMENVYGNPSSLHTLGLRAEKIMSEARMQILSALVPIRAGARPKAENLIFTGSGTEANNLAIIGGATAKPRNRGKKIIIGETEHPSVLEAAKHLETLGYRVARIPSPKGVWDMAAYREALTEDTILVSAMLVNNETGAVNDIAAIARAARAKNPDVIVHCDDVQGFLKVPVSPLPHADMVTVSAHKIGGPKGVGALYVNDRILKAKAIVPVVHGGGQERGLRSGTENVIGIAGFGAAAEAGAKHFAALHSRFLALREKLATRLADFPADTVRINTPETAVIAPHIVSLTAFRLRSETLLHSLSASGVYVSSGSACSSNGGGSHTGYVLRSFGLPEAEADSTVRISFGEQTTDADIDALTSALSESIARLAHKRR
ncbi:MAG: cysteine desulfurase [Clostridia bacterium]|nr:cysteine desulfurase [Clostridia bacterium]